MKKIILILLATFSIFANAAAPIGGGWKSGAFFGSDPDAVALSSCKAAFGASVTTVRFDGMQDTARYYACRTAIDGSTLGNRLSSPASYCQYPPYAPNTSLPLAQQCSDPPVTCTPGRQFSAEVPQGTVSAPEMKYPTQLGGCRVYVAGFEGCNSDPVTGALQCKYRLTEGGVASAGGTDDTTASPIAEPKPQPVPPHNPGLGQGCPAGTVSLGIDSTGGSICGGSGTSPTAPIKTEVKLPPTTTTNADGSTDRVDISHRTNSDGSITTTTKTTTTGADGKVTVKEVPVTGPKPAAAGGGAGVSDAKDEDKTDLCKLHPELNVCKNSEVTPGSCAGGSDSTSCTGDAIQCAILRQQKKEYCEWNKENPSATLGNQAVAGNDPLKSTLPTKENASQFNMQSLDQSGFLGGGSCFQDKSVTVQGIAINLPFSKLCPYLEWLRYVIMIIAALVSLRIVSKPVLGD